MQAANRNNNNARRGAYGRVRISRPRNIPQASEAFLTVISATQTNPELALKKTTQDFFAFKRTIKKELSFALPLFSFPPH
jgi:hypothetical protein